MFHRFGKRLVCLPATQQRSHHGSEYGLVMSALRTYHSRPPIHPMKPPGSFPHFRKPTSASTRVRVDPPCTQERTTTRISVVGGNCVQGQRPLVWVID